MPIKKKEVMWEELEKFKAGTWTLGSHTHPRSEISDFWNEAFWGNIPDKPSTFPPSAHTLASHSTKAHSELSDAPANAHHDQLHVATHLVGGSDPLSVGVPVNIGTSNAAGTATNFARRDHVHAHPSGLGADLHHDQVHELAGEYHTASGLIAGHVIKATGASSFEWGPLSHSQLAGVTSDQHHAQSHSLASHSTKPHSALTGVGVNDHHAQVHASNHHSGGDDQISHDLLLGFVAAEHKSLPNTIAEVLSNHNVAAHNALNITQLGTVGIGVWQGTAIGWAYISKTGSNLTDLTTRQHAGLTGVTSDQHHPQSHEMTGAYHTASGLTVGHVIKATGASSFEWGPLSHSQLAGVTSDQHHAKAHNILSADHPDSLAGSVARGDIIIGNVTPKWSKLSKGSVDQFLGSDGTDLVWMHVGWTMIQSKPSTFPPSAHTLASHSSRSHSELSDSPVNAHHNQLHSASHGPAGDDLLKLDDLGTPDDNLDLNASTTRHGLLKKLPGGTTTFLRADGAFAAPTSSAHNLLSAVHADTGAHDVVRGDMIIGGSGPLWQYLTKGAAGQWLKAGAYEPGWATLLAADLPAHASRHHSGGADQVNHDSLTGFVAAEHKSLPNTIAQVLSNHTKAVHDALLITVLGSGALAKDHGTAATDMIVNVCYGTGNPPTANTTTIGTLFVKYTA